MNYILTKEDIIRISPSSFRIDKYIRELEELNLLSIPYNSPKLLILARMVGTLITDGNLYYCRKNNFRETSFTLGQKQDVDEIIKDIQTLGFKKFRFGKKISNCNIHGRKFIMKTYRVKITSTSFWLLFNGLGVPVGNKTKQGYNVPKWIFNSSQEIKKEFLAGFLGGDGLKVTIRMIDKIGKRPSNCTNINDIEFRKIKEKESDGLDFAQQIGKLLEDFGVKINKIFSVKDKIPKKDGTFSSIIHIALSSSIESAYNYSCIGYRYCNQKRVAVSNVNKFLKIILDKRKEWSEKYEIANEKFYKGENIKNISNYLGISYDTVFGWIKYNKKPTIQNHYLKFDKWFEEEKNGSFRVNKKEF